MSDYALTAEERAGLQIIGRMTAMKGFPASTPTTQATFGPGGLFSVCGFEDAILTAAPLPQNTIAARMMAVPNMVLDTVRDFITGVDAGSGSEPNGVCDDFPTAGQFRTCAQTVPYGRVGRQTQVDDISSAGEIKNRGVNQNVRIVGGLPMNLPIVPQLARAGTRLNPVAQRYALAWAALGAEMARKLGPMMYNGNPTANSAGGGYKEFRGLNLLIKTGHVDAIDNATTCPALDSDIRDFASADVTTGTNGANLVLTLANMVQNLDFLARITGLGTVDHRLAMREEMFWSLTDVWPCNMNTYRCTVPAGATSFFTPEKQMQYTQDMRDGRFLWINGKQIGVDFDDFIPMTRPDAVGAPNTYRSDIYVLPWSILGGQFRTLFMEYIDFSGPNGSLEAAREWGVSEFFRVTDGGMFLVHDKPPQNYCVQSSALIKPRIVLATPQLAGRIQNVAWTTVKAPNGINPTDANYKAGGVAVR